MDEVAPVAEVSGVFADEIVAREVADALNRWFKWILMEEEGPPDMFEPLGVDGADWAWSLEDVDWTIGPHARTLGPEVRISVQTQETYRLLSGLLRQLGASSARIHRE